MSIYKPYIGIFGKMNVGKSTIFNLLAGQDVAITDSTPGTTTDLVKKVVELQGIGPAVLVDTGGVDDTSILGERRVERTLNAIEQVDLGIIVFAGNDFSDYENSIMTSFLTKRVPFFVIHNKEDLQKLNLYLTGIDVISFSAKNPDTTQILETIKKNLPPDNATKNILEGCVKKGDTIVLVMPQDASAPEGRLILPQVQTIRAALDMHAVTICVTEKELSTVLEKIPFPNLIITDSQIFAQVAKYVPSDMPLTSFSILLARARGKFRAMIRGTKTISDLKDGDKILILESCTHTVDMCVDIGRTKLPNFLKKFTGKNLEFEVVAGLDPLPKDLGQYKLAIQCGGCMITEKQLQNRLETAMEHNVPVTNYGMALAYCAGIFERVIKPLL